MENKASVIVGGKIKETPDDNYIDKEASKSPKINLLDYKDLLIKRSGDSNVTLKKNCKITSKLYDYDKNKSYEDRVNVKYFYPSQISNENMINIQNFDEGNSGEYDELKMINILDKMNKYQRKYK